MSARSMLERLRDQLKAKNDSDLAVKTGLDKSEVSKILRGMREDGMRLTTVARISDETGVGFLTLAAWWNEDRRKSCW